MKKIAIVGCGRVSKRHIEAIRDTEGVELALVCDIDKAKAKIAADQNKVPFITDYKDIKDVDVISILTPSGLHPRHVAEIAENTAIPYIVCEKPLSLTLREAYEMMKRVEIAGKEILPVYQNRYNPLVKFVKDIIDDGKLGKIYQFVSNVFWNRNDDYFKIDWHGTKDLDGGVLYTQASHYVDMIHYFFGEVVEHKGIGGNLRGLEVYDTISAVCNFKSGVVGTINATVSTFRKNYLTELTVIAEKGTVRLSGTNLNTIDFWDVEGMEKPDMDFQIDHVYGKGHDVMYKYIAEERWDMFPSHEDILSGIRLMELLSY
jgi:UDP-N-acetyl-2-amino-2-deoxyglucuronate dehydrogenase